MLDVVECIWGLFSVSEVVECAVAKVIVVVVATVVIVVCSKNRTCCFQCMGGIPPHWGEATKL